MKAYSVADLREMGLKALQGHLPKSPFRFESGVSLGTCEIHGGVKFGMHSYMNSGFVRSGVVVGRYCSIGRDVTIGTGHHEMGALSTSSFFSPPTTGSSLKLADPQKRIRVLIGHDVWIGDRAIILSGVRVGHGAVIAAGAIVTHDVDDYMVVGGIPARPIKERFPRDIATRLLELRWWEFDPDRLKGIHLGNILDTVEELEQWPSNWRNTATEGHVLI